ncbi:hypothetical protein RUND412_004657, partial [Rhizina undulata]
MFYSPLEIKGKTTNTPAKRSRKPKEEQTPDMAGVNWDSGGEDLTPGLLVSPPGSSAISVLSSLAPSSLLNLQLPTKR